jgi:hypothetical protein
LGCRHGDLCGEEHRKHGKNGRGGRYGCLCECSVPHRDNYPIVDVNGGQVRSTELGNQLAGVEAPFACLLDHSRLVCENGSVKEQDHKDRDESKTKHHARGY